MSQENKAYIVQLVKQVVQPYFAGEIADILIAHGMTFKTEPQTNADRIRAMSDEELAELLLDGCRGSKCDDQPQNEWGNVNCFQCRMNWLQQTAEEDDHA